MQIVSIAFLLMSTTRGYLVARQLVSLVMLEFDSPCSVCNALSESDKITLLKGGLLCSYSPLCASLSFENIYSFFLTVTFQIFNMLFLAQSSLSKIIPRHFTCSSLYSCLSPIKNSSDLFILTPVEQDNRCLGHRHFETQ